MMLQLDNNYLGGQQQQYSGDGDSYEDDGYEAYDDSQHGSHLHNDWDDHQPDALLFNKHFIL